MSNWFYEISLYLFRGFISGFHLSLTDVDGSQNADETLGQCYTNLRHKLLSLNLKGSTLSELSLISVLSSCENLSTLDISCCNSLFLSGQSSIQSVIHPVSHPSRQSVSHPSSQSVDQSLWNTFSKTYICKSQSPLGGLNSLLRVVLPCMYIRRRSAIDQGMTTPVLVII